MHVIVEKHKVYDAVVLASRMIGKKESLPVLSCILLESKKNELVLRTTNLESAIEIRIPTHSDTTGICAVPAHILMQTIRFCRSAQITFTYEEARLVVASGGSKTTIHTVPHEEFPIIKKTQNKSTFSIPKNIFTQGVRSVAYAASNSTIRQEFGSVYISYKNNMVVFVATDSFRLAEKKISVVIKDNLEDVLIPVKNAIDAAASFEETTEENITLSIGDSQIQAVSGGVVFTSRVIDATFPDYETIIPKHTTTEATLLKEDLVTTLQKANLFSGDGHQIGIHIYPKKKIFSTTAQHATIGETNDSVDAAVSGEDIDINFNTNLISDCLQSIQSDSVVLRFSGDGKPIIIEGVSDKTFRYLVMPLNR